MFQTRPAQDEANLLQASQDMGQILVQGIRTAPVVTGLFSQVAAQMVAAADAQFPAIGYAQALNSAFVRHGVLAPTARPTVAAEAAAPAGGAAFAAALDAGQGELPMQSISMSEYGLGVDAIVVVSAGQPHGFDVGGAAFAVGAVTPPPRMRRPSPLSRIYCAAGA